MTTSEGPNGTQKQRAAQVQSEWRRRVPTSVGLARIDLGKVSVLVRRREVVQRMEGILGLKVVCRRRDERETN